MKIAVGVVALATVLLSGLPASAESTRDMLGRDVALRAAVPRVVSLAPSITETLYALGAEAQILGVTTFCDAPAAARAKPKVGGIVNPSLEAIAALRPDLVLATTEGNREATIDQLAALGIPTYVVRPKSFEDLMQSISRLGDVTGHREAADKLAARMRERVARAVEAVKGRPRPRVLYLIWADPLVVPGRDTLINALIGMAGGESVSGAERVEWPRLSLEHALAMAPDVIVSGSHNRTQVDATLRRWQAQGIVFPALRTGRVHMIEADLVLRPGPRIVDGLDALVRAIHPGALP